MTGKHEKTIELRSDTKTLPTEAMRRAMYEAEVGDDESGEDPSVNRLEAMAADRLGKEAALFTSSGVMSNLLAVLSHTERGDEILAGDRSHIHEIEKGHSAVAGVNVVTLHNDDYGQIEITAVEDTIRRKNARYRSVSLFCMENTHNYCNGRPLSTEYTAQAADVAHRFGIPVHLDGARLFNAAVALGVPAAELTASVDTVCFCLSKGLSCPVGSLLCGTTEFIRKARRWRQIIGGQTRQSGHLAAAGIVALETMIDRLAEDHANARRLADGLARIGGIGVRPETVKTNIVFFTPPVPDSGSDFVQRLKEAGVLMYGIRAGGKDMVRAVTSRMVTADDINEALTRIETIVQS